MTSSSKNGRVFWTAAVGVIGLDVVSKWFAEHYLVPQHVPHRIIGDVVRFTLAYNPGAAFSMSVGNYSRYIFGAFAIIALGVLWSLLRSTPPADTRRALALGLTFGGAAGNLIDRFRSTPGVVDFIDIGVGNVRFWTFNVADSAVTIGGILLAWVLWQEERALKAGHSALGPRHSAAGGAESRAPRAESHDSP